MPDTRRWIAGVAAPTALLLLLAAAAAGATPAARRSARPATAPAPCSVTPVIPADVAIGDQVSALGSVTVPVTFAVSGSCTAAALSALRWVGSTAGIPDVVRFRYHPGPRPQEVPLDGPEVGLVQVGPEHAGPGVRAGGTSFRIRRGAWLALRPVPTPEGVFLLAAQQWTESLDQWGPLGGRLYEQQIVGGHWATLRSVPLDGSGYAAVAVPPGVQVRLIVPGDADREPAVLLVP